MSNIDSAAVMAEARNHPRYNNDPNLYEKLAYLKLSAAKDRRERIVIFQNIQDTLNDIVKDSQRLSERKRKSLFKDFIIEFALYLWLGFLVLSNLILLLLGL